jgi:hypothetical protein
VLLCEFPDLVGHGQQPRPLLLVERDREAAEPKSSGTELSNIVLIFGYDCQIQQRILVESIPCSLLYHRDGLVRSLAVRLCLRTQYVVNCPKPLDVLPHYRL